LAIPINGQLLLIFTDTLVVRPRSEGTFCQSRRSGTVRLLRYSDPGIRKGAQSRRERFPQK